MDGNSDSCVVRDLHPRTELDAAAVLEAVNLQALHQIQHLAHGPLAVASTQALAAAVEHAQAVSATVLEVRVMLAGTLYTLRVQVVATP